MSYPEAIELIKKRSGEMKLSQVELAGKSGVSTSYLSRVFALEREASDQVLVDLATAVKFPPLEILRLAKRLPPEPHKDETLQRIDYLYSTLRTSESKKQAMEYIEFLKTQEERAEYNVESPRKKSK